MNEEIPSAPGNENYGESKYGIYPKIYTADAVEYKRKLGELRLKDFENDLRWLCEKINHYKKIHQRWKRLDNGIRYLDIVVGSVIGIAGTSLLGASTLGVAAPIILTSAVASIPIINTVIHGILNITVFKSRLSKYNKLIRELEDSKNKLFLFHQKALKDEILSDEEIQISKTMVEEIKDKILKISGAAKVEEKQSKDKPNNPSGEISKKEMLKQLKELSSTIKSLKK